MDKYMHEENRLKTAHRAMGFGLASLASACILYTAPFIAFGLGFFSILFGFLSKGYKKKFDKDAKIGMTMAIIGICISVGVVGTAFHKLTTDAEYRSNIINAIEQYYGEDFEFYGGDFYDTFGTQERGTNNVDL